MALELSRGQRVIVTVGVLMALLLASLDQTIVGTAMPRIVAELNGLTLYAWVGTSYLVASATMVPISGRLGDLFGRKRFIVAGMVGFLGASALCGISPSMLGLVIFRGVQGIFGGVLTPSIFAGIADLYPPQVRARMQGIFTGTFALAAVIGPTAGGVLADAVRWRGGFFRDVPLGIRLPVRVVRGGS